MKNTLTVLLASTTLALYGAAYAASSSYKAETSIKQSDDGDYSKDVTVKHKDTAGTTESSEVKTKVDVDANGDADKTVTTEHVVDPKGLLNESKVTTKETAKTHNGTTKHTFKKRVNGNTVVNTESDANVSGNTGY